jgi:hypothetical protein
MATKTTKKTTTKKKATKKFVTKACSIAGRNLKTSPKKKVKSTAGRTLGGKC